MQRLQNCRRELGRDIMAVVSEDIGQYTVGSVVDLAQSGNSGNKEDCIRGVRGRLARKEALPFDADGEDASRLGTLYVRPAPPSEQGSTNTRETNNLSVAMGWACHKACEDLTNTCLRLGGTDNMSATLVLLSPYAQGTEP